MKSLSILALTVCAFGVDAVAQDSILSKAPQDTVLLLGTSDFAKLVERFERTPLATLWNTDHIRELRAGMADEFADMITDALDELGVDEDALVWPEGAVELAVFPVAKEEGFGTIPGYMVLADWGAQADKFAELYDAMITQSEDDGNIEVAFEDLEGQEVTVYTVVQPDEEDEFDDEMGGMGGMGMPMGMGPDLAMPNTLYHVRDGGSYLWCTDRRTMRLALAAEEEDGGLAARDDFSAVQGSLGDNDAYAIVLTRDLGRLLGGDNPMMVGMIGGMLKNIVGNISAIGASWRLDSDDAMIENRVAISMPDGKSGLTQLLDVSAPRGDLPSFAASNSISYTSVNFKFSEFDEFVVNTLRGIPMIPMEPQQLEELGAILQSFTDTLGTQIHTVNTLSRPITADSAGSIYAIECTNSQDFENLLAEFGPQMGLEPRDFLGQRIYSMDMSQQGFGLPILSIGITGGYVVIGPSTSVEQALRSTGEDAGLAEEPIFQTASAALPDHPVVGWGVSDSVSAIELAVQEMMQAQEQMEAAIEEMRAIDPALAEEMLGDQPPIFELLENLDFDLLREHIGPTAWEFVSTDDGFIIRSYLLAPQAE